MMITDPPSRATKYLLEWQAAGLEAGKFFPATESGLADPFAPDDVRNSQPPRDGQIASAGHDFARMLDDTTYELGQAWEKIPVSPGLTLSILWKVFEPRKTRRWNYFITRADWSSNAPLTRSQFEPKPFHSIKLTSQPYWDADLVPDNPTKHTFTLPIRQGYHVILGVCEIADMGTAFYQVIDVDFIA